MMTRSRNIKLLDYLMLAAIYFLCLFMLPLVAVYVFGSRCRALVRRVLARQRGNG
jgi:hypothetical protein